MRARALAVAAVLAAAVAVSGCTAPTVSGPTATGGSSTRPAHTGAATAPPTAAPLSAERVRYTASDPVSCGSPTTVPTTAAELQAALETAAPGSVIAPAAGDYSGAFVITASGTQERPIQLCGGDRVALVGEGPTSGYGLHLDGAAWVQVMDIEVRDLQKGIVVDRGAHTVIQSGSVHGIGDEAIHLRAGTTDSMVRDNDVFDTGNRREKFGEGVYIGSARSNWEDVSGGEADASDRNQIVGNTIWDVTAEAIDIKEGTTGGVIAGNTFDGSSMTEEGADSWVDVKGVGWLVVENTGIHSRYDGFQTHEIVDGAGTDNVFARNSGSALNELEPPEGEERGYLLASRPTLANVFVCANVVTDGSAEVGNIPCRDVG